jgi:hypothetical protein
LAAVALPPFAFCNSRTRGSLAAIARVTSAVSSLEPSSTTSTSTLR